MILRGTGVDKKLKARRWGWFLSSKTEPESEPDRGSQFQPLEIGNCTTPASICKRFCYAPTHKCGGNITPIETVSVSAARFHDSAALTAER